MSEELYLKYRPTLLKHIIGQDEAVASIRGLMANGGWPHASILSGPSGTGKTTVARILRRKLGCSDQDFVEINAASSRGIDTVREIESSYKLAPMGGRSRVWLFDEGHRLTSDGQSGLLKMLEDCPSHVYFMIATTDPSKLLPTIKTRCTEIRFKPLDDAHLAWLVLQVGDEEGKKDLLTKPLVTKIVAASQGSARKALVLLQKVLSLETEEERLTAVDEGGEQAIFLGRALMQREVNWKTVAESLKAIKESNDDPEGVRRGVLGYAAAVVVGGGPMADYATAVLDAFSDSIWNTGWPGLVLAAKRAFNNRGRR
jgi:DNA polymerase-3 subunit gamma/tau